MVVATPLPGTNRAYAPTPYKPILGGRYPTPTALDYKLTPSSVAIGDAPLDPHPRAGMPPQFGDAYKSSYPGERPGRYKSVSHRIHAIEHRNVAAAKRQNTNPQHGFQHIGTDFGRRSHGLYERHGDYTRPLVAVFLFVAGAGMYVLS